MVLAKSAAPVAATAGLRAGVVVLVPMPPAAFRPLRIIIAGFAVSEALVCLGQWRISLPFLLFPVLFLSVPEVGVRFSLVMLNSELSHNTAIPGLVEVVEDDTIHATTLSASLIIDALESGGNDFEVFIRLQDVHFLPVPHALEQ